MYSVFDIEFHPPPLVASKRSEEMADSGLITTVWTKWRLHIPE